MLRPLRFLVAILFFAVLYITTLAPALETTSNDIKAQQPDNPAVAGVITDLETALFVGMPLLLVGGIIVTVFVISVGLRGTSR